LSGTTSVGSAAIVKVASGGTLSVASGAVLDLLSGGTAIVSGTLNASGTVVASGSHSLVDIVAGAVVNGGLQIGAGIVDLEGATAANVTFISTGSGGLELSDSLSDPTAFAGNVAGFGGSNHANHGQYVVLTSVTYSAGETATYSAVTASAGVLTVSSGGHAVAKIDFVGQYVTSNFHLTSASGGFVKIADPPIVVNAAWQSPAPLVQAIANFDGPGGDTSEHLAPGSTGLFGAAEHVTVASHQT
jgi:hypothetical protein